MQINSRDLLFFLANTPIFRILPADFFADPQYWREQISSGAAESTRREPTENLSADEILFAPLALRCKISQSFISGRRQNQITDLMEITSDKDAERANVLCWFKQVGHHYGHHASRRR